MTSRPRTASRDPTATPPHPGALRETGAGRRCAATPARHCPRPDPAAAPSAHRSPAPWRTPGPHGELLDPPRRWRPRARVRNGADRTHQHLQALLLAGHREPARQRPPRAPAAARRRRRTGLGAATPEDVDAATIIDYRDDLYTADTAESTRSREIIQLGHFYRWLTGSRRASRRAGGQHGAAPHPAPRHQQPPGRVLHHRRQPPTAPGRPHRHRDLAEHRHHDRQDATTRRKEWLAARSTSRSPGCCGAPARPRPPSAPSTWPTSTWTRRPSPGASTRPTQKADLVTQPIPTPWSTVLGDYLARVRPQLRIGDDRLLVNPSAQRPRPAPTCPARSSSSPAASPRPPAGHQPGGHAPGRWAKTYGQRILDAEPAPSSP